MTRLLLLHGLMSNGAVWDPIARRLEAQGIETLTPDLLGYRGAPSPEAGYSLDDVADALEPLLDREQPTAVAGHSMGGIVALELARRHPGRFGQVGLIATPVYEDRADALDYLDRRGLFHMIVLRWDGFAHAGCRALHASRRFWLPVTPLFVPGQPRPVVEAAFDHCAATHSGSLDSIIFGGHVPRLAAAVDDPVAVLHGTDDEAAAPERIQQLAAGRGWRVTLVPGGRHQVHVEAPEQVANWLAGLVPSEPRAPSLTS